jgi:hypothetical protein
MHPIGGSGFVAMAGWPTDLEQIQVPVSLSIRKLDKGITAWLVLKKVKTSGGASLRSAVGYGL